MNRRSALKTFGLIGASAVFAEPLRAKDKKGDPEFVGVLVDTTRCAGCRSCEYACAEANGLPEPDDDDEAMFASERQPSVTQWSVVNRYETDVGEVFAKKQCMHCCQPACATACLTRAMLKTTQGPVVWRESKCMGCRFCMLSCPFDIPKFEYDSPVPKIQKCRLCWERLQEGEQPACVEECPEEALLFGTRKELLDIAKSRIYGEPDKYVHNIYGEHEVGGTGWLYLSPVPFEQLGLRTDLGTDPYPELTKEFLYAVPIILTLWPAFLLGVSNATKREKGDSEE
ncbi:MAG: 4Fe-4S dicluster domain-containing protein [Candidatus Krumholzibacteria bacterium]|nr:4Fe-4S dicluster domain-containing protein [Candidatus Krumholzibacteria bacterium]